MVCVLDNAGMSVSDNPSQGIVREGLWPFVCFGLCLNDFPDVWDALKKMCYTVYTVMCFLGLNACLWIVYDLGFRGVVRPEVWAFVSLFLSIIILGGIHFLKDFLRTF